MPTEPLVLARHLQEWQEIRELTNVEAAAAIGAGVRTYEGWKAGNPVRERWHQDIAEASNTESIEQFLTVFATGQPRLTIQRNFLRTNEVVFATRLATCSQLWEVRTAFPTYPSAAMRYRRTYYDVVRSRLLSGKIVIRKIEQVTNIYRAVELLANMRDYDISNYHVRLLKPTPWFPSLAFTVFDQRAVIAGVSHNTIPLDERLLDFVGTEYADYFLREWDKMWNAGLTEISPLGEQQQKSLVLEHLRLYGEMTRDKQLHDLTAMDIDRMVIDRLASIKDYATRY